MPCMCTYDSDFPYPYPYPYPQVLGGNGYMGEYQVERLWRDAKLLEIGGGTNEAHHKNMFRDLNRNHKTLP